MTQVVMTKQVRSRRRRSRRARARKIGLNLLGLLVALVTLFPIFYMLSTSFKPSSEIETLNPHLLPSHPTLGNFSAVMSGQASGFGGEASLRSIASGNETGLASNSLMTASPV